MTREELSKSLGAYEVNEYFLVLSDQEARMVPELKTRPWRELGDLERIREYSPVLRQVLLHRAIKLTKAVGESIANNNGYALGLNVRGHIETTAAIGYLHNRLNSLREGNITPEKVSGSILTQLFGTRNKEALNQAAAAGFEGFKPIHIHDMLRYADKSAQIIRPFAGPKTLMDIYEGLSELCHPNFHSNSLAFDSSFKKGVFVFRYEGVLKDDEIFPINGLTVSAIRFIEFYDGIEKLLP